MIYLLWTAVGLLAVIVIGVVSLLYLATRDTASDVEDDDEECDLGDIMNIIDSLPIYVSPVPPYAIVCLGPKGQHDQYPWGDDLRLSYENYLDAMWSLPTTKEPGATL